MIRWEAGSTVVVHGQICYRKVFLLAVLQVVLPQAFHLFCTPTSRLSLFLGSVKLRDTTSYGSCAEHSPNCKRCTSSGPHSEARLPHAQDVPTEIQPQSQTKFQHLEDAAEAKAELEEYAEGQKV